jgi:hypothetical protein
VCDSPYFVCPREAGAPAHFLWEDVHRIVWGFPDRIAHDFANFLEAWGLAHFDWAGLGDPFTSDESARALRLLYDVLAPMFRAPGVSCLKTANSLIYQIRRPFPPVHLINVGPLGTCHGTVGLGSTTRRWPPTRAPAGPRVHPRFLTSHLC